MNPFAAVAQVLSGRRPGVLSGFARSASPVLPSLREPPLALQPHVVYGETDGHPFARGAMALGLLTSTQIRTLSRRQTESGMPLGEVAVEAGVLTPEQVQQITQAYPFTVHIDARHAGNPLFLTWLEDLHHAGVAPAIHTVTAQELASLRHDEAAGSVADERNLNTLNLARRIFTDSAAMGASDIHMLVRDTHAQVQIRVKGDLKVVTNLSMRREEGEALVRATYTGLSTVKQSTYNPLDFQDAQISGEALPDSGLSGVRIIRGPAYPVEAGGGFMVARLQYGQQTTRVRAHRPVMQTRAPTAPSGHLRLLEMGYTPVQVELIERLVRRPMGIVAVTGPTGSGKTTTLYECMRHQARLFPQVRQVTIENPPEYPMPWAIQLSTESEKFSAMLRMALRMDPDILLLSELRAAEEAIAAVQAAMTGHFVWTTLHVTDPYKTVDRLETLDHVRLARKVVCDHELLVGLIAQRLVPRLCPHCSRPLATAVDTLPAYMVQALHSWGNVSAMRVRGRGCTHCDGDATTGKRAVAEIVLTDEQFMSDCVTQGVLTARRNHRRKPGVDRPMIAHAMDLVLAGVVDPRDVQRSVDDIPFAGAEL
ncbi:GspE/PulE family protein [Paraburkholderia sp. BCC1885]|uniref:GspE/PulE family protein n=1 Tax=Paraburkholderia sp. BCC1885 TaxID=2562669 RepID=UPI0021B3AE6F|nr:ATPase, T2SS/T4P/T4SS family [Paraburkholderia sp. BCC1885]